ncbi:MAG TPA: acyltransferase family protein [Anaerolineae bacterium]|nr:acyltransferase family protein [Anaerolineae bacterium]
MTTTVISAARPVAAVQPKATARLLFVDNIRVFLTVLVILHHLMIIYAGSGSWGLYTEGRQDTITSVLGTWFTAVNQAYFMGFFLLIAAYFVPGSYDRKGAWPFFKDRLIRLGIPLIIYSWIISPLTYFVVGRVTLGQSLLWWQYLPGVSGSLIGNGPLWFVEVLLIFTAVYVAWRKVFNPNAPVPLVKTDSRFPSAKAIVLFAVLMAAAAFVIRLWLPVGWEFGPLNLQFPFFVQYIALFVVGLIAYQRNWLACLSDSTGKRWLIVAIVLIALFIPMAVVGGAMESNKPFLGGLHWQAAMLALWESLIGVSMCIGLTYLFRRHWNQQGRLAKFLSPNAYTAYIIHAPIITFTALALRNVEVYPLLKFGLAASIALPLCFVLSNLIRKLPYTDRVL